MKIIEQLTLEQEALAIQIKDKWIAIALSTKKPDIAKAEKAICLHYHYCRRNEPREIKWFNILKKVESQQKNKYWVIPEETTSIEEAFKRSFV